MDITFNGSFNGSIGELGTIEVFPDPNGVFVGVVATNGDNIFNVDFSAVGGELEELIDNVAFGTVEILLGDINCDGDVDLEDVAPFVAVHNSGAYDPKADMNQDDFVSLLDIVPFVVVVTGG